MLKGKTAIITGGSRGLGAAIACRFASMGADIAIIYSGSHGRLRTYARGAARKAAQRPWPINAMWQTLRPSRKQ